MRAAHDVGLQHWHGSTGYTLKQNWGDFLDVRKALDLWGWSEELTGDLPAHWSLQSPLFMAAVVLVGWVQCCCKRMCTVLSPSSLPSKMFANISCLQCDFVAEH